MTRVLILALLATVVVPWCVLAQENEARKAALGAVLRKAEEEYRLYFKRPTKPLEFWAAIRFEVEVGKYDVAALHLDQLLKLEPPEETDKDLLKVEEARGLNEFLRLQSIPKWDRNPDLQKEAAQNVVTLINRVTAALEKKLASPERITRFIRLLSAPTVEERNYAFVQLNRSRERVSPYLVDALRKTAGKREFEKLKEVMLRLHPDILPPLLEVLKAADDADAREADVRPWVIDLMRLRREDACLPYLWHIIGSDKYHPIVRSKARQTAAAFLNVHEERLPSPKEELTWLAERYYQHQIRFPNPQRIRIWPWDGKELGRTPIPLPPAIAEALFGVRHAKEALDLDPAYGPAQSILLRLTLERAFLPALDNVLLKPPPPAVHNLLATLDADLLMRTLERTMTERNPAVMLPIIRALGERREIRAARPTDATPARGLARTLYYPDRRVQWAGVRALLLQPSSPAPVEAGRVVDLLTRFLVTEPASKAVVLGVPEAEKVGVRKSVQDAGLIPVLVDTPKSLFETLHRSADADLIIIHQEAPTKDFAHLFAQLRADADAGLLPVLVLTLAKTRDQFRLLARRYPNIFIDSLGLLEKNLVEDFKGRIEEVIKYGQMPDIYFHLPEKTRAWLDQDLKKAGGFKLTVGEKKQMTSEAMYSLWRMARGELPGYNIRPAKDALFQMTTAEEYATAAIEALGRLPGIDVQQRLAGLALDPARPKAQRIAALAEVNRHVHQYGLLLTPIQIDQVRVLAKNDKEDPNLLQQVALLAGTFTRSSRATGIQLRDFRLPPPPPPAPVPPPPPEKKEEN